MSQIQTTPIRLELPTGLPVGGVNVYLFTEPEPILLDTGVKSKEGLNALKAGLAAHNLQVADLSRVIISHPHVDHFGLAGTIAAQSNAGIYILEEAIPWLANHTGIWQWRVDYYANHLFKRLGLSDDIAQPAIKYYQEIGNVSDPVPLDRITPFQADEMLSMGGLPWQVLQTPGHARTLTCFYQAESKQFLSTDMLLPIAPTPIVDPPPPGQYERIPSLPQFIQSLERVEALDVEIVFPGHGDPFTNHREVIARQRARINKRKMECLRRVTSGEHNVGQLLLKMYTHYPPDFRIVGLWMVIGYLDLLQAEGLVIEDTIDGVWHYQAVRN